MQDKCVTDTSQTEIYPSVNIYRSRLQYNMREKQKASYTKIKLAMKIRENQHTWGCWSRNDNNLANCLSPPNMIRATAQYAKADRDVTET